MRASVAVFEDQDVYFGYSLFQLGQKSGGEGDGSTLFDFVQLIYSNTSLIYSYLDHKRAPINDLATKSGQEVASPQMGPLAIANRDLITEVLEPR